MTRSKQIEEAASIRTTDGFDVLIDCENLTEMTNHTWSTMKDGNTRYAMTSLRIGKRGKNGKPQYKRTSMHRLIMKAEKGQIIDHANRNGLDNRKANLRFCTHSQNTANSIRDKRLRGVFYIKDEAKIINGNRWQAAIRVDGKTKVLGVFDNPIDAAIEWDIAAKKIHKEFAVLNFKRLWEWADQTRSCARDQNTTQFCHEALDLQAQLTLTQKQLEIAVGALKYECICDNDFVCDSCEALAQIEELGKK